MQLSSKYDRTVPLRDKIIYVLSMLEKASGSEVAIEIMELEGISTEETLEETVIGIEEELGRLLEEGLVEKLKEHRQKIRYALTGYAGNQVKINHSPLKQIKMSHEQNQRLMDALAKCAAECSHCATACLQESDVKMLERCIKLDIDCAEICELATGFVARGSEHAEHILRECADICNACAEECGKHSHMDHCRKCAEACRVCAEACSAGVTV